MGYLDNGKQLIKEYVAKGLLPGAVFSFVDRNNVVIDHCGYRALLPEKEETSVDTLYDIASLSKVVSTTTLVLMLMEEGSLSLKDRVVDFLPEFPYSDITIRDLLTHTSGYIDEDKRYKSCRNKEELWRFTLNLPPAYDKGSRVVYSCFNFIILGKIIEVIKGDFESFAQKALFDQLGKNHIMYRPFDKGRTYDCAPTEYTNERGFIRGSVHDGKANILGGVAGNAGVFADIFGLSRFVMMLLNDGQIDGRQLLQKSTVALLNKSYTRNLNESRTLGWYFADQNTSAGDYISSVSLYHTGFTGTSIYVDFKRQCGIVLLANAIHPNRENRMNEIRNRFHNLVLLAADADI